MLQVLYTCIIAIDPERLSEPRDKQKLYHVNSIIPYATDGYSAGQGIFYSCGKIMSIKSITIHNSTQLWLSQILPLGVCNGNLYTSFKRILFDESHYKCHMKSSFYNFSISTTGVITSRVRAVGHQVWTVGKRNGNFRVMTPALSLKGRGRTRKLWIEWTSHSKTEEVTFY
jgi:hypothetical protein